MTGTPPWTIAISDGTTIDTISGIDSPVFAHVVCPTTLPVDYTLTYICLLYTSDAADERSSVDLGGRRIIKKKNT